MLLWAKWKIRLNTYLWYPLKHCYDLFLKICRIEMDWNIKNVQLEITYRCNKLCRKCIRHCNLTKLPYLKSTDMTIGQIEKFVTQVKQKGVHLNHIQVLGGEPLLHPELNEIISILYYKLVIPGNLSRIEIWTNGLIDPAGALKKCRLDSDIDKAFNDDKIVVIVSPPGKDRLYTYVLNAPVDLGLRWDVCAFPRDCGILVNSYGYWPSGVCGQIALMFGMTGYRRFDFPTRFRKTWPKLKQDICKYCVIGCKELVNKKEGRVTTSYKEAIARWMQGAYSVPGKY